MTTTLLTTVEVAERLGLSAAAVAQAVRSGQLEPAARTATDFLFNERAIAAFERARIAAAAEPPTPAPESSRSEWTSELGRLNTWLGELNLSLAAPAPVPIEAALPVQGDARPPGEPEPIPPRAAEPGIQAEIPPPHQPGPTPAAEAGPAIQAEVSPAVQSDPNPAVEASSPVQAEALAPPASAGQPELAPDAQPLPAPEAPSLQHEARPVQRRAVRLGRGVSRQAVLMVQPISRFRTMGEVASALDRLPGLVEARLQGVERGVASYRLTMGDDPASGDEIAAALASFNLELMLVEAGDE